jgi:hypothetical protein
MRENHAEGALMKNRWLAVLLTGAAGLLLTEAAPAQTRPIVIPQPDPVASQAVDPDNLPSGRTADQISGLKTSVEFQILSGNPAAGYESHRWVEALRDRGVTVRVRTPKAGDELGVDETIQGTLRWVVATGELDAQGQLKFPDRSFSVREQTQLKEWIDELKLYGAQGAPEGKPLWGLTNAQFSKVFESLSTPVAGKVRGQRLDAALEQLRLPEDLSVRYHSTAIAHIAARRTDAALQAEVQGLSCGTALAGVLANYGLGYRPLRTPAGAIELVVEPLANLKQPWPIGWEPDKETSRGRLAPGLYKMVQVGFDELPLDDILNAVSEAGQIPVVINYDSAAQRGIDLNRPVSYPQKRAAYMMVLGSVIRGSRLKQDLRVDERGVPFVYVTAFVPRTIEDLSPAESD